MKYDNETTKLLIRRWDELGAKNSYEAQAAAVSVLSTELAVPEKSIIAKVASLGLYNRKKYTDKRGLEPVKKEEYVEKIAKALNKDICLLESLEKVNKSVLKLLLDNLAPQE